MMTKIIIVLMTMLIGLFDGYYWAAKHKQQGMNYGNTMDSCRYPCNINSANFIYCTIKCNDKKHNGTEGQNKEG